MSSSRITAMGLLCLFAGIVLFVSYHASAQDKPRVIVCTDGEADDKASFVRFLLYTNDYDVEGLIYTSSQYHYAPNHWTGSSWMQNDFIPKYAQVYSNLIQHDASYPTPESLTAMVKEGNINQWGTTARDAGSTAGSNWIISVLEDDSDPRPVWVQCWGGTCTVARAVWDIKRNRGFSVERQNQLISKLRVFAISNQEGSRDTAPQMRADYPNLYYILNYTQFDEMRGDQVPFGSDHWSFSFDWMMEYIVGHGVLCDSYTYNPAIAPWNTGLHGVAEGDTPSFLHNLATGLRSMELPSHGGWGGRFAQDFAGGAQNYWKDTPDDGDIKKPMNRWFDEIANDFASRCDWCITTYEQANHRPVAVVTGGVDQVEGSGAVAMLDASGSYDPDGGQLQFKWWRYADADTAVGTGPQIIQDWTTSPTASFTMPTDAMGRTVHVILQVRDDGEPALTHYARLILTIGIPIDPPTNVHATSISMDGICLRWDDTDDEDEYVVIRRPWHGQDDWHELARLDAGTTQYCDTADLHGMVDYTYRIGAVKNQ